MVTHLVSRRDRTEVQSWFYLAANPNSFFYTRLGEMSQVLPAAEEHSCKEKCQLICLVTLIFPKAFLIALSVCQKMSRVFGT